MAPAATNATKLRRMAFDPAAYRKVLGHFATGITVVTTAHEGTLHGMTVNSFTSVSMNPPLVLFCADKRAHTHGAVQGSGIFAVNMLRETQRSLSDLFAAKDADAERYDCLSTSARVAETGSPILADVLGWVDCRVSSIHDAGDHVVYIGKVVAAGCGEVAAPLLYYRGTYQTLHEAWRWSDRYAARDRVTHFDEMVDFFERMEAEGPYASLLEALAALAAPAREARCLDIGCGAGRLVRALAACCREAVGVDVSARMLERASTRAKALGIENASYREARAEALPFECGAFDLVTAANLLMIMADPPASLKEAARVLRPGGHIALLEPTPEMSHANMMAFLKKHEHGPFAAQALLAWSNAAEAHRLYDEAKIAAELRAAGFDRIAHARHLDGLTRMSLARRI
jgi:flavin reductase (DIM6/NTAB) family NADH-FMN oxidoreductase RutF/ubiquinone/menaquinone biosynthesis C-methylase UbiE